MKDKRSVVQQLPKQCAIFTGMPDQKRSKDAINHFSEFVQALELVDCGLNAPEKKTGKAPIKRGRTGCVGQRVTEIQKTWK